MTKYRIEINLKTCIGAFTCVDVAPELWEQGDDGKAHLIAEGVVKENGREYVEINDTLIDVRQAIKSQDVCPVQAIKVTKLE
jgi:ferredoxin